MLLLFLKIRTTRVIREHPPGGRFSTPIFSKTCLKASYNPFRTAAPFWGQTPQIPSDSCSKRDCGPKRVMTHTTKRAALGISRRAVIIDAPLGVSYRSRSSKKSSYHSVLKYRERLYTNIQSFFFPLYLRTKWYEVRPRGALLSVL